MRDWDKTIDELRKNIEDARKRWVLPYLDPTQFDVKTSEDKSKVNAEEQNISTNEVSDTEKVATEDSQVVSSTEKKEAPVEEVKGEKAEEVPKIDMAQVDATLDEVKSEEVQSAEVADEKVQKVDAAQVDAMLDEVKSEEAPAEEVKEEKVENVPKVDATQVNAMLDEVKSEEAPSEKVKEEKVKEVKQETKSPVEENKPIEKPKRGKKKVKEIKPDYVLLELAELEAINEEDLSEEQEDRLMELRRIKTQRAMHVEADEQFQSEMKQADEEIKTLKSQLKIKDPLPKGYIE
mgnify:FL=1